MDPPAEPNVWKAVALASLTVSTGLLGIVLSLVKRAKPKDMTNGNRHLLERLERLEDQIRQNTVELTRQGQEIAHIEGRLEPRK